MSCDKSSSANRLRSALGNWSSPDQPGSKSSSLTRWPGEMRNESIISTMLCMESVPDAFAGVAAVDVNQLPADEARGGRGKEARGTRHVVGRTPARQQTLADLAALPVVACGFAPGGLDPARCQ